MPIREYTDARTNQKCPDPVQTGPESLSEILDRANHIANETLSMTRRLNIHLFNQAIPENEGEDPILCFSDALGYQVETLKRIHDELKMVCKSFGVEG